MRIGLVTYQPNILKHIEILGGYNFSPSYRAAKLIEQENAYQFVIEKTAKD